jgi:O-antigen ligase
MLNARETWMADVNNPVRCAGLNLAMIFLFLRFTGLHEVAAAKLGINTYALYIVGLPAIVCLLLSGGLARTLRARQAKYWLGFVGCLILSIPFSDWRGGSIQVVITYLRTDFIVLFLTAGLVMTWRECWRLLGMLSTAAVVAILLGKFFRAETVGAGERLAISSGLTMGNANDYAALLTLLLPFLVLVLITPSRAIVLRIGALGGLLSGLYMILSTGSRGAEIAILAGLVFILYQRTGIERISIAAVALAIGALMAVVLPGSVAQRLTTLAWSSEDVQQNEAAGSGESRWYLLRKSLLYTAQKPLFGVGPGQFADHEGIAARKIGLHGNWHETHNTYTQVSSEAGIPAAIFFIAALVSTYRLLSRTLSRVRARAPTRENVMIAAGVFCVLIATVAFCCGVFFLSLAYGFYLPALTGIAIALSRAAEREWDAGQLQPAHLGR